MVADVILVSALGPNPSFFWGGTFIQLRGLLGLRIKLELGPGLDKNWYDIDID